MGVAGVGSIEKKVLSLKSSEELSLLLKSGVDSTFFVQYSEVFSFVVEYFNKYDTIPSKSVLKKSCDFERIKLEDDFVYYIDQLLECKVEREVAAIVDKGLDLLEKDPHKALDYIASKSIALKGITTDRSHLSHTDRDASRRAELLADKVIKANQDVTLGIPTGIAVFDKVTGGWFEGQFVSVIGRLEEGKSWVLMHFCVEAYKSGKSILYLSPEMTVEETELRFDTIMSKKFRNTELTLGRPTVDVGEYKKYLKALEKRNDWKTYDSIPGGKAFSVASIRALVNLHKPDVLAIDGIPLIDDEGSSEESWQRMFNVCYGLKGIAVNNGIVVLATSQATRESAREKGIPKLHQVAYGDALAQACDKIVGICKVSSLKIMMGLPKNRSGKVIGEFYVNFDVDKGIIGSDQEDVDEDDAFDGSDVFTTGKV